jgi:hypothetical protein
MRTRLDHKLRAAKLVVGVCLLVACSASGARDGGQGGGAAGAQGTGGTGASGTPGGGTGGGDAGGGIADTGGARGSGGTLGGNTGADASLPGAGDAVGTGGASGPAGTGGRTSADGATGTDAAGIGCDTPGLVWKTAAKTEYTSYPDPGSPECIEYSGCEYMGMFAACSNTATEEWVAAHNIVAAFPDFGTLKLHDLCLKSGTKTIIVTVIDTCGDSDCSGCCTRNKGTADELIDIESYTAARFGAPDGRIEWADLGPTKGQACP